jgi:hypothetical protein
MQMARWKKMLAGAIEGFDDREAFEAEYRFNPPASDGEIARLEQRLGTALPADLRSLLLEFNGVAYRDRYWGKEWRPLYLSVQEILGELEDYIANSGNPAPPAEELDSVAFFAQQNGFAVLFALCIRSFGNFAVGQVLSLDHETGEFELERETLEEFVSDPAYCTL